MKDNAITASLTTAMNNAKDIVKCKIEEAINLANKQEVHNNRNKIIIYCFDLS